MAAIDKLYLHSYWDLVNLRKWSFLYYPQLFLYFYDNIIFITRSEFEEIINHSAKEVKRAYRDNWKKVSSDGTILCAVAHLMDKYQFTEEDATREAQEMYKDFHKSLQSIQDTTTISIMNTPFKVDRKLKWICPLPCIRKYLHEQCGVKEHWYYKLFWRGKKYFKY